MAYALDNCVFGVSGSPGTGAITPGSTVAGSQSLASAGVASGQFVPYAIADAAGAFEYGRAYWNGTTLTRTTILGSSNSGSAITATSAAIVTVTLLQEDSAPFPWLITGGLPSSLAGTNTTATMTVGAGQATDQSLVAPMKWTSFSWAITNGNAANGCSAGTTLANATTYHMYVCWGSSGFCSYASSSFNMAASSAPSGYQSYVRRLFSFLTSAGGALLPGVAREIYGGALQLIYTTAISDLSAVSITTTTAKPVSVPGGLQMQWLGRYGINGTGATTQQFGQISSPDEPNPTATMAGVALASEGTTLAAGGGLGSIMPHMLLTNTSAQLNVTGSTSANHDILTSGYVDFRRS